jgi:hypothetical protein
MKAEYTVTLPVKILANGNKCDKYCCFKRVVTHWTHYCALFDGVLGIDHKGDYPRLPECLAATVGREAFD